MCPDTFQKVTEPSDESVYRRGNEIDKTIQTGNSFFNERVALLTYYLRPRKLILDRDPARKLRSPFSLRVAALFLSYTPLFKIMTIIIIKHLTNLRI